MQNNIAIQIMDIVIRKLKRNIIATPRQISQNKATTIHARLKATTCRYLNPERRARSLSTLIAIGVNRETPPKITPKILKRMERW